MVYLGILAGATLAVLLAGLPIAAGRVASSVARKLESRR